MGRSLSNLPPGCSSPDGGIDHEYETALDKLTDVADTPELLSLLTAITPQLKVFLNASYRAGRQEGQTEAEFESDEKKDLSAQRINQLEKALQQIDSAMSGNEQYDASWLNYPDKPERSPKTIAQEALGKGSMEIGKRYQVTFKERGQRVPRVMVVQYIGDGDQGGGPIYYFSGRPRFGTLVMPKDVLISFKETNTPVHEPMKA